MTTSSNAPGGHSNTLSLMSCVRESSPQEFVLQADAGSVDQERNDTSKKRRFHPFRGLRKMFRRKIRHTGSDETVPESSSPDTQDTSTSKDSHRSRSTSELLSEDEAGRRKSGAANYPGLSVSHDSVFTADQQSTSSDLDIDTAQSTSSLSIQQLHLPNVRAELLDVVRRRRGRGDTSEDEEDLGLPRSPCNSPTTTDNALKDHQTKSHSTCSDGSLLSMGSSEMDEDYFGPNSRHSSKLSISEKPNRQTAIQTTDTDLEFGVSTQGIPLSHSAARHKMSIKPKRTHGAPRRRRNPQITSVGALPTTIEVNEEAPAKSAVPDSSIIRESVSELYSTSSMNKAWNSSNITEHQLKSSSLPPGLALSVGTNKLSRSRSNAGTNRCDVFHEEEEEEKTSKEDKKKEESFFGRFLARRSGKKQAKKSKSEDVSLAKNAEQQTLSNTDITSYKQIEKVKNISVETIKTETVFSYKQIDDIDSKTTNLDDTKISIDFDKAPKISNEKNKMDKIKLDNLIKETNKSKLEEHYVVKHEYEQKIFKNMKIEESNMKVKDLSETSVKKILTEETTKVKTGEVLLNDKQSKKDEEKHANKTKSDIKTNEALSVYKQNDEKKHTDSVARPSLTPRTGPAARQRIQPIDIPASPEEFKYGKRQPNTEVDIPMPPFKNSPDDQAYNSLFTVEHVSTSKTTSYPHKRQIHVPEELKQIINFNEDRDECPNTQKPPDVVKMEPKCEDKSKIKVTDVLSCQTKIICNNELDSDYKSLDASETPCDKTSISKAHNVQMSKVPLKIDLPANSFSVKSDSPSPIYTKPISPVNEQQSIESDSYDSLNKSEPLSFTSHSDSLDGTDDQKSQKSDVTISCVNSHILSSVNTQSSNQVIVSIRGNNTISNEPSEIKAEPTPSQISITRVQLKKDPKIDQPDVPEFLKIQLNKVDVKSNTNIVLSTSNENIDEKPMKSPSKTLVGSEVDKENGESLQRKFSKDDVEIIEKNIEEKIEVPKIISSLKLKKSEEINKENNSVVAITKTERKNSISPPLTKPVLKKKSNSIELSDSAVKNIIQNIPISEKNSTSAEHLNPKIENIKNKTNSANDIQDTPDPVMLRRKSSSSIKKEKESDEPELMKVFARRSLKLKDSEAETLSQQVMILVENSNTEQISNNTTKTTRSNDKKDSDKENEFSESPQEERKKIFQSHINVKETKALAETKTVETSEVTTRKTINNKISTFGIPRYQKTTSCINPQTVDNSLDTRKTKSFIEQNVDKNKVFEKNSNRTKLIDIKKSEVINTKNNTKCDGEVISNVPLKNTDYENEEYVPMFKRISQRKEEWEQRAQQAMKKSVP